MEKQYEYTIDEERKIIYFPPPSGGPPSWMAYARSCYFRDHFGYEYQRVTLTRYSWGLHIKENEVKTITLGTKEDK